MVGSHFLSDLRGVNDFHRDRPKKRKRGGTKNRRAASRWVRRDCDLHFADSSGRKRRRHDYIARAICFSDFSIARRDANSAVAIM